MLSIVTKILCIAIVQIGIILMAAYLVWFERKMIAAIQLRRGPNIAGKFGLLQPIADAIKILHKEIIIPNLSNPFIFLGSPMITFICVISSFCVIPIAPSLVFIDMDFGALFIVILSSLSVYGVILGGWASGSWYSLFGALRAAAQMISYEITMGMCLLNLAMVSKSLNLTRIIESQSHIWFCIKMFPIFIIFFISSLAETNRTPFDLPEAESELVGGFHTEYSSMPFTFYFLGEYIKIILLCALNIVLFCGGWYGPSFIPPVLCFAFKLFVFLFLFIWIRATLPRLRYDQLMKLNWLVFLPFTVIWFMGSGLLIALEPYLLERSWY